MAFEAVHTEALVTFSAAGGFERTPIVLTNMRDDEVLVEMLYSGICHSDIVRAHGGYPTSKFPAILGHEGAGIIRRLGSSVKDQSLQVGDSVILSFSCCSDCRNCLAGHPSSCYNFEALNVTGARLGQGGTPATLIDGTPVCSQFFGQSSFGKMSVVNQHSVVKCPYPDQLEAYAALGCGFQTGAGTVINALKPKPTQSILILGMGSVGMAAVMASHYLGLRQIIAVDVVDQKLEMARQLGATHVVNSKQIGDLAQTVIQMTSGGADFAIDCTGATPILRCMLDCVGCGGTAAVVGSPALDFTLEVDPMALLHQNKSLRGICQGDSVPQLFIPQMIEMHRSGKFPVEKLCKTFPIGDMDKALAAMKDGSAIKTILRWD